MFNQGDEDYHIKKGDRIAQLMLEVILNLECHEACELDETERDDKGFGSSGVAACGVQSPASTVQFIDHDVISMPLRSTKYQHRNHDATVFFYSACVARPVTKREARSNQKAMQALDKEWNKLASQGCWGQIGRAHV